MKETSQIKAGDKIYFSGDKLPFKVAGLKGAFVICTRKLNRIYDSDILRHKVSTGAYCSFAEAYEALKDDVIYTIIDIENKVRGTDDYVLCPFDYSNNDDINTILDLLNNGAAKLSTRNMVALDITKYNHSNK